MVALVMAACADIEAPTPQKLSQDIKSLPSSTIISVISNDSYKAPKGVGVIERIGLFETLDNTYDDRGYQILIPRRAIVKGTYVNDGKKCTVTWSSIYFNKKEYEKNLGSVVLKDRTIPTDCDPQRGVQAGERLLIHFNRNFVVDHI